MVGNQNDLILLNGRTCPLHIAYSLLGVKSLLWLPTISSKTQVTFLGSQVHRLIVGDQNDYLCSQPRDGYLDQWSGTQILKVGQCEGRESLRGCNTFGHLQSLKQSSLCSLKNSFTS